MAGIFTEGLTKVTSPSSEESAMRLCRPLDAPGAVVLGFCLPVSRGLCAGGDFAVVLSGATPPESDVDTPGELVVGSPPSTLAAGGSMCWLTKQGAALTVAVRMLGPAWQCVALEVMFCPGGE